MTRSALLTLVLALALAIAPGCETTGAAPDAATMMMTDDTGAPPEDANVDAGPMLQRTLSYTPEGCSYVVTTPNVRETGRSDDTFGADATPNHIHSSWAGPSDTTFAVNWHTDNDTHASSLLIGTDMAAVMAADDAGTGVTRHDGHWMRFQSGTTMATAHEVHVCGLTADTEYFYRVGGPGNWSQAFPFSTGPVRGATAPFTFGVTGDSRGYEENAWAITEHRMQTRAVDFEVFSGDAVVAGTNQGEWDEFFEQSEGTFLVQDFLASHPMMMANGNHDLLTVNYLAQFALPQDATPGEVGQGEDWYSYDYGNAHFVVLNDTVTRSTIIGGEEATWLEADLNAVDRTVTPWIFVTHHQPMYTCTAGRPPDTALRAAWQTIFDRYHVDMVFNGHNHEYERSAPIFGFDSGGGHVAPEGGGGVPIISSGVPSGTIYMVAAGAGAPLYSVNTDCPETREAQSVRVYLTVAIDNRTLHLTAYDSLTDTVIDELQYTK